MLSPTLSLYPGHQSWDGAGAGGDQRPSYGRTLAVLAVAVLLGLLAVLLYLLLRPPTAQDAAVGPPSSARSGTGDAADLEPPAAAEQPGGGSRPAAGGMSPPPLQLTGAAALTELVEHDGGLLLVRMAHHAEGPFSVALSGQAGREAAGGSVAEVTGTYRGTRAVSLPAGRYTLDVEGAGWWGVTLERPRYGSGVRLPHTLAGVGDTATRPFEVAVPRTVRMRWTVESDGTGAARPADLDVRVLDATGDVVARFDASDGAETRVDLDAGVYLLDVATSAGVWRVHVG